MEAKDMSGRSTVRFSGASSFAITLIATVMGLPIAQATSFPQYPLQTGASYVPPNILFVLDDSGSMGRVRMPVDSDGELSDSISDRSSAHNTVYYNPNVTYQPWMKPSGERMTGGTSYDQVYSDYDSIGNATINLLGRDGGSNCKTHVQNGSNRSVCGADQQTYYVPKVESPSATNNSHYYRFQLRIVNKKARVIRSVWNSNGNINADMGCSENSSWRDCTYVDSLTVEQRPGGRSEEAEIKNYATWYSYHRTRMKMAKAGAAEAFAPLGNNIRVGYRTIHGRNTLDIPVTDGNSGRFEDATGDASTTAKSDWFDRLFAANSGGTTPLRIALDSAGKYYEGTQKTGPYGPETGTNQFACRQNFTILTTDGYWNDSFSGVGNQDNKPGEKIPNPLDDSNEVRYEPTAPYMDSNSNTLADIAMKYWKSDLVGLENIVPTTPSNPAFWQHMVTFGISIGLGGSLDQGSVEEVLRDGSPRKNGVNVAWPSPSNSNAAKIDDLLHAAVNGRGSFIAAKNAEDFGTALQGMLGAIQARLASGSNVSTNSTSFQGGSRMFQATYMSGHWTGDIVARDVTAAGGIASGEAWRVSSRIAAVNSDASASNDYHKRPIMTWSTQGSGRGESFPTAEQSTKLGRSTGLAIVSAAGNADYIKGKQSLERSRGGVLRNRSNLLGDIVNSSPFYVKDNETLYVGANDGMLHAINALTGDVLFSYVPFGLDFGQLATLSEPEYTHKFFVDGPISVSTSRVVSGKNYLVGALGRGGKGVFGLDVTNPTGFRTQDVLWDNTGGSDNDMGYVLGQPILVKGNNNKSLAIVANGIDSVSGNAVLYVYDLVNGNVIKKLNVGGGLGLSAPRGADMDGNGTVDYVYAGDLTGRAWKFDLSDSNPNNWKVAYSGAPLFTAVDDSNTPQPITGGLALALEPVSNRVWITFGTGRLISLSDLSSMSVQSIYGVIDGGAPVTARSDLTRRTIAAVGQDSSGRSVRAFESHTALPSSSMGWYVNLGDPLPGERVVSGPRINGRAVWVSSVIPDVGDGCQAGGTGYLNALDVFTGTSPSNGTGGSSSFFDFDGDGSGENDTIPGTGRGDEPDLPIGSIDFGIGMPTESEQIDELVLVCGSDGVCEEAQVPPGSGTPKRVGWRELFNRD